MASFVNTCLIGLLERGSMHLMPGINSVFDIYSHVLTAVG